MVLSTLAIMLHLLFPSDLTIILTSLLGQTILSIWIVSREKQKSLSKTLNSTTKTHLPGNVHTTALVDVKVMLRHIVPLSVSDHSGSVALHKPQVSQCTASPVVH